MNQVLAGIACSMLAFALGAWTGRKIMAAQIQREIAEHKAEEATLSAIWHGHRKPDSMGEKLVELDEGESR